MELLAISPGDVCSTDVMQGYALKQFWSSLPFPRKMSASPMRCRDLHLGSVRGSSPFLRKMSAAPVRCRDPHLKRVGALCHFPGGCPQHRCDAEISLLQFLSSLPFPRKMSASPMRCRDPHFKSFGALGHFPGRCRNTDAMQCLSSLPFPRKMSAHRCDA